MSARAARLLPLLGAAAIAVAAARADGPASVDARPPLEDAVPSGPSLASRIAEIQRRIQEALVYPPLARQRGLAGEARVEFAVSPQGRADAVHTVQSSGSPTLDRAAEDAVARARDLPFVYGRL